ncbi:MAG: tagatose 1,6-diphosphate aldolase [Planctomycetales bacterium]|nr:tagatose 1,6-diphosphate aldolase [Planctomycetales bacterium]
MQPPVGVVRSLQIAASERGIFKILAVDHWESMSALIAPSAPDTVSPEQLTELKLQIVRHVAGETSAVILDPVYSVAQAIRSDSLPRHVGFLTKAEQEQPQGPDHARRTELIGDWSAAKAKAAGACGVKLFLYYHPHAGELATRQETIAQRIAEQCTAAEIAFFLEPIVYSIDPSQPTNSPAFARQRRQLTIETVKRLAAVQPTVFKLQFPVDGAWERADSVWREACAELDDACNAPWAILSAGDPFELFKAQLQVACEAGCSGFLAGRALWREAAPLKSEARQAALDEVVLPRLRELNAIADQHGKSWQAKIQS